MIKDIQVEIKIENTVPLANLMNALASPVSFLSGCRTLDKTRYAFRMSAWEAPWKNIGISENHQWNIAEQSSIQNEYLQMEHQEFHKDQNLSTRNQTVILYKPGREVLPIRIL